MTRLAILALGVVAMVSVTARAQKISPNSPPPPPPAEVAPPQPEFDPYRAAKSIEVGNFYLKKGHYDAAIDRFQEAARYQPGLAEPWKLLGEAYEKKRDYRMALDAYNKYLQILPGAPDAEKVKKIVASLQQKLALSTAKH